MNYLNGTQLSPSENLYFPSINFQVWKTSEENITKKMNCIYYMYWDFPKTKQLNKNGSSKARNNLISHTIFLISEKYIKTHHRTHMYAYNKTSLIKKSKRSSQLSLFPLTHGLKVCCHSILNILSKTKKTKTRKIRKLNNQMLLIIKKWRTSQT